MYSIKPYLFWLENYELFQETHNFEVKTKTPLMPGSLIKNQYYIKLIFSKQKLARCA